jgi:hypothetical protein
MTMYHLIRLLSLSLVCSALFLSTVALAEVALDEKDLVPPEVLKKAKPDQIKKVKEALPEKAPKEIKSPRKLLVFSKTAGFRHSSIELGTVAIALMGKKTGAFTVTATEDDSYFEPKKLAEFDAVLMLNTTGDVFKPRLGKGEKTTPELTKREEMLKESLVEFVKSGKGLAGIHSATDTYKGWAAYNDMMGGAFVSHPWNANDKVLVRNMDKDHPLNASFSDMDFEITDEIYMFRDDTALAKDRRYLLSLSPEYKELKRGKRKDGTYPISWVSTYGKGKTFYCSLGHREDIFWNPKVLKHYLAGLQYAFGDLEADATPKK